MRHVARSRRCSRVWQRTGWRLTPTRIIPHRHPRSACGGCERQQLVDTARRLTRRVADEQQLAVMPLNDVVDRVEQQAAMPRIEAQRRLVQEQNRRRFHHGAGQQHQALQAEAQRVEFLAASLLATGCARAAPEGPTAARRARRAVKTRVSSHIQTYSPMSKATRPIFPRMTRHLI